MLSHQPSPSWPQIGLYLCIFLEGNFGHGSIVFTVVVALASMLAPFLLVYTLFYYCRQKATRFEDFAVYVPIVAVITASVFFVTGIMKLFLDQLKKDVLFDIIPEFDAQDHCITWLFLIFYVLSSFQAISLFHRHVTLIDESRAIEKTNLSTIVWLLAMQIGVNVMYFVLALEVMADENACAVCTGCAELVDHRIECNRNISELACEDAGYQWCESMDGGRSYTTFFVLSYGLISVALGMTIFLAMAHIFGDESLRSIKNHHQWALLPVVVFVINTLVCGSGVVRILFRVLGIQPMRDVYHEFPVFRVILFWAMSIVYVGHLPVTAHLILVHLKLYKERCDRANVSKTAQPTVQPARI